MECGGALEQADLDTFDVKVWVCLARLDGGCRRLRDLDGDVLVFGFRSHDLAGEIRQGGRVLMRSADRHNHLDSGEGETKRLGL